MLVVMLAVLRVGGSSILVVTVAVLRVGGIALPSLFLPEVAIVAIAIATPLFIVIAASLVPVLVVVAANLAVMTAAGVTGTVVGSLVAGALVMGHADRHGRLARPSAAIAGL